MIGLTFRDISEFSGVNHSVNTAIQLNFLVPFSYVCITLIKKYTLQKIISSLLYIMKGISWYHTLSHDVQTLSGIVLKDFLLIFVMFVAKTKYLKRWVLTNIN